MGGLYEVLLYVCLIGSPHECREQALTWSVALPAPMCAAKAYPDAKLWELMHPGWLVKKTICRPPRPFKHV